MDLFEFAEAAPAAPPAPAPVPAPVIGAPPTEVVSETAFEAARDLPTPLPDPEAVDPVVHRFAPMVPTRPVVVDGSQPLGSTVFAAARAMLAEPGSWIPCHPHWGERADGTPCTWVTDEGIVRWTAMGAVWRAMHDLGMEIAHANRAAAMQCLRSAVYWRDRPIRPEILRANLAEYELRVGVGHVHVLGVLDEARAKVVVLEEKARG